MIDVVVSHYNEDLNWVNNLLNCNVHIYSKTLESHKNIIKQPFNLGNEASSYLEYIIDNYDCIPDWVYFCHGHNDAYHQNYTNEFIINNVDSSKIKSGYLNINNYYNKIDDIKTETLLRFESTGDNKPYKIILDAYNEFLYKYIQLPESFNSYACAQFFVNSELIKSNSLEFYKESLDWFYSYKADNLDKRWHADTNVYSSRLFEWIWHYIFTKNCNENIVDIKNYLK